MKSLAHQEQRTETDATQCVLLSACHIVRPGITHVRSDLYRVPPGDPSMSYPSGLPEEGVADSSCLLPFFLAQLFAAQQRLPIA